MLRETTPFEKKLAIVHILALVAILPLLMLRHTNDPIISVRMVAIAATSLALALMLRGRLPEAGGGLPKWPQRFWWLFVGSGIVASAFGMVPADGLVETLRLLVLTGAGYGLCWAVAHLPRPATWIAIACSSALVLLAGVAWGQHFELATWLPAIDVSPTGTMGNTNLLGAALMLLVPGALLGLRDRPAIRVLAVMAIVLGLAAMYWARSAGAWVGLGAGLAVACLYVMPLGGQAQAQWRLRNRLLVAGFLVGAVALGIWSWKVQGVGSATRVAITQDSGIERILMGERSLDIIYYHPLLGCGPDNWNYAVLENGFVGQYQGFGTRYYMQAHNDYLQALAEYGIPGGLCFVLFLGSAAWLGWRRQLREVDPTEVWLSGMALGGLVAWMVNAMFSFPFHQPYHTVLLLLWIAVLGRGAVKDEHLGKLGRRLVLGVLVVSALLGIGWYGLKIKANALNYDLLVAKEAQDWPLVLRRAEAAQAWYNPDEGITKTPISWYKGIAALNMNRPVEALAYLQEAMARNPWHPMVMSNYGVALVYSGDLAGAERTLSHLIQVFAGFDDARINLVSIYIAQKNWTLAELELGHWHGVETNGTVNSLREAVRLGRQGQSLP